MVNPFPLSSTPSYYANATYPTANRNGIFYVGDTPTFTLSQATPTAYTVRDYYGNLVSSGAVSGTTLTPATPSGGWKPGWYRVYMTGTSTDPVYGPSYGAFSFVVIRVNANFITNPDSVTWPNTGAAGDKNDGVTLNTVMRGVMGMGVPRVGYYHPVTDGGTQLTEIDNYFNDVADPWVMDSGFLDTQRPRYVDFNFPNQSVDVLPILNASAQQSIVVFVKDLAFDGANMYVEVVAGSVSGQRLNVYYPDSATLVESFDNIVGPASAFVAACAGSGFIVLLQNAGGSPLNTTKTAIGSSFLNGVTFLVNHLYATGYRYFEGPENEPRPDSINGAVLAQKMKLFNQAVHAGNASAKAIGPCTVDMFAEGTTYDLTAFFATYGGGTWCDEISFHDYNSMTNGDLNHGRHMLDAFQTMLAASGNGSKALWQTEALQPFSCVFGIFHPRRARVPMLKVLLWEQYGLVREKNVLWYDCSHGFWGYPAFLCYNNNGLDPLCALMRVLAEETFGMNHASRISFGTLGNHIFAGSIYSAPDTSGCAVIIATSHINGSSVTFTVTGTSSGLTYSDAFGNENTAANVGGRVTVPCDDVPTYLRLPAGVSVTVFSCNDWPQIDVDGQGVNLAASATSKLINGSTVAGIADGNFSSSYPTEVGVYKSTQDAPDNVDVIWSTTKTINRVVVWCGSVWQRDGTLLDFDVQTTTDGSTWTTQLTQTSTSGSSFVFGSNDTGCGSETFWDEQWVFDLKLPSDLTVLGVRIHVRKSSVGGEPDAAALAAQGGRQGTWSARTTIQEVQVFKDLNLGIAGVPKADAFLACH